MSKNIHGHMPFALIAVALLLLSGVCTAVAADYRTASDTAVEMHEEELALERASSEVARHIDRGLGERILAVSLDDGLGSMEKRKEAFQGEMSEWMENNRRLVDSDIHAVIRDYDIDLIAQSMLSDDSPSDGFVPAYLKAVGTAEVEFRTQNSLTVKSLDVLSDGSCALPFAAEQSSLFDSMTSGGGISVSQMMTYQLTCLAQHRVMNGYGGMNEFGGVSTDRIIERADVVRAYDNAMQAAGALCFRSCDSIDCREDGVDLADMLVMSEDGYMEVDVATAYAQAIADLVDDISLKWFEYFSVDKIIEAVWYPQKLIRDIGSKIRSFLLGEDDDASPYIREVMSRNGLREEDYRWPGSGCTSATVGGVTISVANPVSDLMSMPWISTFKSDYEDEENPVLDGMREMLNRSAMAAAGFSGKGSVRIHIDPYDGESFVDTLRNEYEEALDGCRANFENVFKGLLNSLEAADPFYGAIAKEIQGHSGDFIDDAAFKSRLWRELLSAFPKPDDMEEEEYAEQIDGLFESCKDRMLYRYHSAVTDDLALFDALKKVHKKMDLAKEVAAAIGGLGLSVIGIFAPVDERMDRIAEELVEMLSVNPHAGILELPGDDRFRLEDEDGCRIVEKLELDLERDAPAVTRLEPLREKCIHTIGFDADRLAAYSTTFAIELDGLVEYRVEGSGTLAEDMGKRTSCVKGSAPQSITLEVTVASPWALQGIEYSPSNLFKDEMLEVLTDLLEPIIEPLKRVMAMVREAVTRLAEKLVDIGRCCADALSEFYSMVMDPMEYLSEWISEKAAEIIAGPVMEVLLSLNLHRQIFTFCIMGFQIELKFNTMSLENKTKDLLTATFSGNIAGLDVSAGLEFKARGEVNAENLGISGFGKVKGDEWNLKMHLDPLMKNTRHLITLTGRINDTGISLVAPDLDDFHELGVALSDIPGVSQMISNIPIPVLGVKAGIDAGFQLRYDDPSKKGLLINEFESNPEGEDRKREWVELYNNTPGEIDLDGFKLVAASDKKKKIMNLEGTISPHEHLVVYPDFTLINSKSVHSSKGEGLILYDGQGTAVDKTGKHKDTSDDGCTWHRDGDGSTKWVFGPGTEGTSNEASVMDRILPMEDLKDIVWTAVNEAFGDVEAITDLETLQAYIKSLIVHTLDGVIDHVSGGILDASVFVKVDLSDLSGTASGGVRLALRVDGGIVEDTLKYIAGQLESMILNIANPYRIDPVGLLTENLAVDLTFDARIGFPRMLSSGTDDLPDVDLGLTFRTNLAAFLHLAGIDAGKPGMTCGVRLLDCPAALIPPKLHPDKNMDHDLWLLKISVDWS